MGGHERPRDLVPKLGTEGRDFMTGYHTILDCCGLGFDLETKSFQVSWLV